MLMKYNLGSKMQRIKPARYLLFLFIINACFISTALADSAYAHIPEDDQQYISPYNYSQNPFGLVTGLQRANKNGTLDVGISGLFMENFNQNNPNKWGGEWIAEFWGQTARLGGFALGGAFTASNLLTMPITNPTDPINQLPTQLTNQVGSPSQAYINYQFRHLFDISAGNILLNTPWVLSELINPYYLTSTFQGVVANIQPLSSLLITAFGFQSFRMPANNWFTNTTLYNLANPLLPSINLNNYQTPGALGIGLQYTPTNNYLLNAWFYQFYNYINMAYLNTQYIVPLSTNVGMTFGLQGVMQSPQGSNIIGQQVLVNGQNAGSPNGNAYGLLWSINTLHDTVTLAVNQVFGNGSQNQFLGGGLVTPYTLGFEYDPLYTTMSTVSLAEQGAGTAFAVQNTLNFFKNSMSAVVRFASYNVQQTYTGQPSYLQEWDALFNYTIPHTKLFFQGRFVYVQQPVINIGDTIKNLNGNYSQIRFMLNYLY